MNEKYNNSFNKIHFSDIIFGIINILIGLYGIVGQFNEIVIISIFIKCTGFAMIIAGIIRLCGALYKKRLNYDARIYCFADELGIYGKRTNLGFMFLAFANYGILCWANLTDVVAATIIFVITIIFTIWTAYGELYRRTRCIYILEDEIIFSKWNSKRKITMEEIKCYTNSLSFGGYKAIDYNDKTLFKWALFWGEGRNVCDYLDSNNIKYILKK